MEKPTTLEKQKRILIIRSATRIFSQTMESIKAEFLNSHITVLAPECNRETLEQNSMIDTVITLRNKGRMSLISCGSDLIHKMRSQSFDLVVSLYNIEHGVGYSNIDLLAWSMRPNQIRGYNSKGTYVLLSGKTIFQKMFREKTSGLWIVLNIVATMVLFTFITIGISAEFLFRKIFQRKKLKIIQ